ncbi:MAG: hypothetical protein IT376_13830 [Polyangiaceae bacterium]|nr:hypothetical protein [Polyangiaceae bacterium]
MTIGTLLRPAAPSGPVPTNVSFLDDVRLETQTNTPTATHAFVPDRDTTITVSARAVAQRVGDDTNYATVGRRAVVRTSAAGVITLTQEGAVSSLGPLTGLDLTIAAASTPAPQHIEVTVTGQLLIPIRWQVAVEIFQLDRSG